MTAVGRRRAVLASWVAWWVACLALPGSPPAHGAVRCERIVAVGDLHGGYEAMLAILRAAGLIDESLRWRGEGACLIQLGDIVDRGPRSRDALDYLMALQRQDPEHVTILLGNHEVMSIVGDLRYVTPGQFAAFAPEETERERLKGWRVFRKSPEARKLGRRERREVFEREFPPGWFARRRAFSPDGRYGSWLLSRPVLFRKEATLFVHGGVTPQDAAVGIERLNREIIDEIREYMRDRDELVRAGWLDPLVSFGTAFSRVGARLEDARDGNPVEAVARRFLGLRHARFDASSGPLWNRSLAEEDESAYADAVNRILELLHVDRIVVGHTTVATHRITPRFDNRVFLIDTGAGPAYGGHVSALEIRGGVIRAIYPDESEILVSRVGRSLTVPWSDGRRWQGGPTKVYRAYFEEARLRQWRRGASK